MGSKLRSGYTRSCGCLRRQAFKDETGRRYGRLLVLRVGPTINQDIFWVCQCDCGELTTLKGASLRSGSTRSCGCYARERSSQRATHGWTRDKTRIHPIYNAWVAMRARCQNPNTVMFNDYGGRGIRVDPVWNDFEQFRKDMEPTWKKGLSLDRIDNHGPYSPVNCRWATLKEQANNTRRSRRLTFQGETLTMAQWAEKLGLNYNTLDKRLKIGWPLDRALASKK